MLARGGVWLGRSRVQDAALPAPAGASITIHRPPDGTYAEVQIEPSDILYEDTWLLALNKRAGWYTGDTPWDTYGNVRAALTRWLQKQDGSTPVVHLAHQLDRDTSGVLLCSKHTRVNALLHMAFASGAMHKRYLCICEGEPTEETFEMYSGHGRAKGGRWRLYDLEQVGMALPDGQRVRYAHTSFRVGQRLGDATLLQSTLHTGRTHQIRLHLAALGHPLLGDVRYGGAATFRGRMLNGHLLHASYLRLPHPATDEVLELQAAMPDHMLSVVEMGTIP